MKEQILFIGVDVDDNAYHGHARGIDGEQGVDFRCKPTARALVKKLEEFKAKGYEVRTCYEATYLGYSLHRELKDAGFKCDVIAPSLIPRKPGEKVKTDKLDCRKLSEYFKNNQLTIVQVPGIEQETVRDLVRSRLFLKEQVKATKLHILAICRRMNWHYREQEKTTHYWTRLHWAWLNREIEKSEEQSMKFNLKHRTNLPESRVQNESRSAALLSRDRYFDCNDVYRGDLGY
jgi:transposase